MKEKHPDNISCNNENQKPIPDHESVDENHREASLDSYVPKKR